MNPTLPITNTNALNKLAYNADFCAGECLKTKCVCISYSDLGKGGVKFLLTRELGRLAKWLRILGYDTQYCREDKPSSLVIQALREQRIIVTRNRRLSVGRGVKTALLKAEGLKEQLGELLKGLNITPDKGIMFCRCTLCNRELKPIAKQEVRELIPPYVYETQEEFTTCPQCKRIYWPGTHWGNVQKTIAELTVQ